MVLIIVIHPLNPIQTCPNKLELHPNYVSTSHYIIINLPMLIRVSKHEIVGMYMVPFE
jgi:hypothetical protein